jgi:Flp pilus assembly pilin Flp
MKTNILSKTLCEFLNDEQGQDLIEYTLLLAFVCLASATLFIGAGRSVSGIWVATNTRLAAANVSAS